MEHRLVARAQILDEVGFDTLHHAVEDLIIFFTNIFISHLFLLSIHFLAVIHLCIGVLFIVVPAFVPSFHVVYLRVFLDDGWGPLERHSFQRLGDWAGEVLFVFWLRAAAAEVQGGSGGFCHFAVDVPEAVGVTGYQN